MDIDFLIKKLKVNFNTCYIIYGNDYFFISEIKNLIYKKAKKNGLTDFYQFNLDKKINWEKLYNVCCTYSLLSNYKIITINVFYENYKYSNNMDELFSSIKKDIILIIVINQINLKKYLWLENISLKKILIKCVTPNNISNWIIYISNKLNIKLENNALNFLCYFYKGNLIALNQILNKLSLIYKDKLITSNDIKDIIYDSANFSIFQLIESIFLSKKKLALRILYRFKNQKIDPTIIFYYIYNNIIEFLNFKTNKSFLSKINLLYKINLANPTIVINALKNIRTETIITSINLMIKIENALKKEFNKKIWLDLELLIYILCDNI